MLEGGLDGVMAFCLRPGMENVRSVADVAGATTAMRNPQIAAQCCTAAAECRRASTSTGGYSNNLNECQAVYSGASSPFITLMTYGETVAKCASVGLQLCAQSCVNEGCYYNRHPVYTSLPCPTSPPSTPPPPPPPPPRVWSSSCSAHPRCAHLAGNCNRRGARTHTTAPRRITAWPESADLAFAPRCDQAAPQSAAGRSAAATPPRRRSRRRRSLLHRHRHPRRPAARPRSLLPPRRPPTPQSVTPRGSTRRKANFSRRPLKLTSTSPSAAFASASLVGAAAPALCTRRVAPPQAAAVGARLSPHTPHSSYMTKSLCPHCTRPTCKAIRPLPRTRVMRAPPSTTTHHLHSSAAIYANAARHAVWRHSFSSAPTDHEFFQPAQHTFIRALPERVTAISAAHKLAALGLSSEASSVEAAAAVSVVVNPWDDSYGYAGVEDASNSTRRGGTYIGGARPHRTHHQLLLVMSMTALSTPFSPLPSPRVPQPSAQPQPGPRGKSGQLAHQPRSPKHTAQSVS